MGYPSLIKKKLYSNVLVEVSINTTQQHLWLHAPCVIEHKELDCKFRSQYYSHRSVLFVTISVKCVCHVLLRCFAVQYIITFCQTMEVRKYLLASTRSHYLKRYHTVASYIINSLVVEKEK